MRHGTAIGVLFSRSGPYRLLAEASHQGTMDAVNAVNADGERTVEFHPVERDPGGSVDRYAPLCEEIMTTSAARHVFGCTTSWSRKEVIPILEKTGGTLWYACPYEGFEANEHVVYMHACPNQHLVPLLAYVFPRYGTNGFFVGSNYIWGWETNRVARDVVGDAGGSVLGERYLSLGDTDVHRIIEEIRATRPNFVLNHLIGPTSYAFFRAYGRLCDEDPSFSPTTCPILSCNLTEIELPEIGPSADGHLSVGPWFASGARVGRERLVHPRRNDEHSTIETPDESGPSSFYTAAYSAVTVLADRLEAERAGVEPQAIFAGRRFETKLGLIAIDPNTQHASLPVRIARAVSNRFAIVETHGDLVAPDPYLSRYDPSLVMRRPMLRVVS